MVQVTREKSKVNLPKAGKNKVFEITNISEPKTSEDPNIDTQFVIVTFTEAGDVEDTAPKFTRPVSLKLVEKSNLGKIVQAVYSRLPDIGQSFELESLVGQKISLDIHLENSGKFADVKIDEYKIASSNNGSDEVPFA